jgi:hypothetical protein
MNRLGEKLETHSNWFVVKKVISTGNTSISNWFYKLFLQK